jgi:hypothetical protein
MQNKVMKFAATLFWWQHRRLLKTKGYTLTRFWALNASYWDSLAEDRTARGREAAVTAADEFSRQQLRARW